jgi:heparin binding hemagglutinin HbhA
MFPMTAAKTGSTRKARTQNGSTVNVVLEQARTPLFAAFGATDIAAQMVRDAVAKAREQVAGRAEAAKDLPSDLASLRDRLGPTEVRKAIDQYTEAVVNAYHKLAAHGEDAYEKLREQPQVKRAIEQLESVATTAQGRADDVLGKVTRQTRSVGEKAARATERVSDRAAEAVDNLGEDVAHEVRSTTRKAANRTAPTATRRTTTKSTKSTGTTSGPKSSS